MRTNDNKSAGRGSLVAYDYETQRIYKTTIDVILELVVNNDILVCFFHMIICNAYQRQSEEEIIWKD